jgi:chemotaxis-related protein WspD
VGGRLLTGAALLLDREVPEGYLRQSTETVAASLPVAEANFKSVLVFRIGSEWLALPTAVIKEIGERSTAHRLPHRSGLVEGIVSIRGEILVLVALEVLLGLRKPAGESSSGAQAARERLIVCEKDGDHVAFVASDVHGVLRYLPRNLRHIPATVERAAATYSIGILPWTDGETIGCLDAGLVFFSVNKGLA